MVVSPISGFMPIPLALMIPFMATQSIVMGEAFGKGFQYGKRKISAMDNETFNKTELSQLISETFKAYHDAIPSLKESINQSTDLQNYIVSKLIDMPRELIDAWVHAFHGHDAQHSDGTTFESDPHKFLSKEEQIQHYRHGHQEFVDYRPTPTPGPEPEPEPEPTLTPYKSLKFNVTWTYHDPDQQKERPTVQDVHIRCKLWWGLALNTQTLGAFHSVLSFNISQGAGKWWAECIVQYVPIK